MYSSTRDETGCKSHTNGPCPPGQRFVAGTAAANSKCTILELDAAPSPSARASSPSPRTQASSPSTTPSAATRVSPSPSPHSTGGGVISGAMSTTSSKICGDGMYLHIRAQTCFSTCPFGHYGDRGDQHVGAHKSVWTCKPCVAGCSTCHDPFNCADCSTTCTIGDTDHRSFNFKKSPTDNLSPDNLTIMASGGVQYERCSTCVVQQPEPLPGVIGPGSCSGGPSCPKPTGATVNVIYNVTVPPTLGNVSVRTNVSYVSTDTCGITKNRTTNTITGKNPSGNNQELWCSRWSKQRHTWITDGCSATELSGAALASNSSKATVAVTVACACSVMLPVDTKDDSFSADFSLIANYVRGMVRRC